MIIDASVATHWFVSTAFSNSARKFLHRDDLIAPALIRIELTNSLLKYLRIGVIELHEIKLASLELDRMISVLAEDEALIESAIDVSAAYGHKIYDCLYLALALERGESLVTADRRMSMLAGRLGISVEFVEPPA
jgi:predicted nucleic acid-binding protein